MSLEIAAGSLAVASPSVVSRRTREPAETKCVKAPAGAVKFSKMLDH
jgi:hypothetical protein